MTRDERLCQDFGNGCPGNPAHCVPCGEVDTDALLAREKRRRILFAPICVGILSTVTTTGRTSAGSGSDGPRMPVLGKHGGVVGWQRGQTKKGS